MAIKLISGAVAIFVIDHGRYWNGFNHVSCWIVDMANRWDTGWYLVIASNGYSSQATVFFPLYPALIRLLTLEDSFSNLALTGFLISLIFFFLALIVIYMCIEDIYSDHVAKKTIWFVALFPASFFLTAIYPTSLYLLAIALYFLGLVKKRLWMIVLGGLVAALSWNSGFILGVGGLIYLIIRNYILKKALSRKYALASILSPLAGIAVYGIYLWFKFGTPFAAIVSESQEFHLDFGVPLYVQSKTVINWASHLLSGNLTISYITDNTNVVNMFNIVAVVFAIAGFYFMIKDKKTLIFIPFVSICLLVYISVNHDHKLVESTARMVMVLFPLWAALVSQIKSKRTLWELYILSTFFMIIGNMLFAGAYWMT